ncbi:hypothetical protein K490DRAFT_41635 [Saccharata proteae CBS 121410]|uniref:tRNA (adenine(58)-N(1))-methyltransferase non-catalytic subunit TRM6 n=1 Tax=Saccharata proteae CBS 121410 TaxID=1314787 RepID=A0A9P4LXD8_9PEZI|nr:hypothetical protein K490DRAFT_41635 [Saccharata proteae CBS 121410]
MHSRIRPHTFIALRLPSGLYKVVQIIPNTIISLGKFGSFPSNALLGRPYNLTFDILDSEDGRETTELRLVPASELHAETIASENAAATEPVEDVVDGADPTPIGDGGVQFDIVGEDGAVLMRNNRLTVDSSSRQALSMEEIEALKKATTGSGKEIIAKIMASHQALDEKTAFSLAKYTLRKSRKYLKRFTVLPMDVGMLTEVVMEREHHRIMEAREEILGLVNAWGNVHYGGSGRGEVGGSEGEGVGGGRWLVVDETGGLIVAAMAEKMGILYPPEEDEDESSEEEEELAVELTAQPTEQPTTDTLMSDAPSAPSESHTAAPPNPTDDPDTHQPSTNQQRLKPPPKRCSPTPAQSAPSNTLTLLHSNAQPNLGLLKHFSYDASAPSESTTTTHPLHTHLKTLSWLQLLDPSADTAYAEPAPVSDDVLKGWKSSKRGSYFRKRRRWERTRRVVDETRRGGFDGLVVASAMDPVGVLRHCVPLLRGGGNVVIYSPTVEPLAEVMDLYSRDRRSAFMTATQECKPEEVDEDDFPLNPTLLLAPMLQTSRVRSWQVLPQRTHPVMTSRGGAEGYVFSATRVLPVEGRVEARGKFGKANKRKRAEGENKVEAEGADADDKRVDETIANAEVEVKKQKVEGGAE